MAKQQTLTIVVPDGALDPIEVVRRALDATVGQVAPVYILPVDDGTPIEDAVLIIEED